jgi:hypothetical protein
MLSDPGNMPFQRFTPDDHLSVDGAPVPQMPQTLRADSILLQEFNHANVTAYQVKEERASTFNTYLVFLGIITSAFVALESFFLMHPLRELTITGVVGSLFATLESVVYFTRLFALGSTVQDSAITMNVIKEFYIQQLKRQMPQLEQAFHWRLADTNDMEQSGRMPAVMSLTLSLSGSMFFSFAVYLILSFREEVALPAEGFVQTTPTDIIVIALAFVVSLTTFVAFNAVLVHRHNPARVLQAEAVKLGLVVPVAKRRAERSS